MLDKIKEMTAMPAVAFGAGFLTGYVVKYWLTDEKEIVYLPKKGKGKNKDKDKED